MSGRGGGGWRGGRGGHRGGGSDWYPVDIGRSGHGGFAGAAGRGGGGGGGRRPWKRGGGPMGHRYEDPRRDARVQKNTDRGRGRGGRGRGGGGRGGQEGGVGPGGKANDLHTWNAGRTYAQRETGPRQQIEGVNFDAKLNDCGNGSPIRDGKLAVEGFQRDRLMKSDAQAFEAADVKSGLFLGSGLQERDIHSLTARAVRTQPPGTRFSYALRAENRRDGPASSEVARDRLLRTMIRGDPFAVDMTLNQMDRRVPTENAAQSADTTMQDQVRKESGDAMDYEQEGEDEGQPSTQPGHYADA
ncbi:hypothetical protein FJTKL_01546 [Diaporthe vaccinii]|uniref:Uncharacterized protein n=1 Tax=Diaporthe vaccinii TaxID=105482 RepID=A0ABR4E057_9PEZI